jgi:hypothetical protein
MGNFLKKLFLANIVFVSVNYLLEPKLAAAVLAIEISGAAAVYGGIFGARFSVYCTERFMQRFGKNEGGPAGFGIHMFLLFGGGSLGMAIGVIGAYLVTMTLLQRGLVT